MKFPELEPYGCTIPSGGKLTGIEINEQVKSGGIIIEPYTTKQLNPNSYNLRLANTLKTYVYDECIDSHKENKTIEFIIPEEGIILLPNRLYLGRTIERVATDLFIPSINGRSSGGRLGLSIHICAGFGDIGFDGTWTLEITVTEPLRIYAGDEIAQVCFDTACGDTTYLYRGRYQNQHDVTASKFEEEKKYSADEAIERYNLKTAVYRLYNQHGSFEFTSKGYNLKHADFSFDLYPGEYLDDDENIREIEGHNIIGKRYFVNSKNSKEKEYVYVRR